MLGRTRYQLRHTPMMFKGKEQPETLVLPKPGAMRKTVGLSHVSCATPRQLDQFILSYMRLI
jgi:hypothetical protein